ncbi:MAG: terminase gpA endonuclease subunit, partial [Verrucomicrobiota bacterium]
GKLPTLESLNEVLAREYNLAGTEETVRIKKGMIDSGYNSETVYNFCHASRGKLVPAKGWDSLAQPVKQAWVNVAGGGSKAGAFKVPLFHFDDSSFKHQLYIARITDRQGPKWHIPHNVGPDYIQQLTAERLVERKNARGVPEFVWHRIRRDNHLGDCEKMQLVQGHLMGPELSRPAQASPTPGTMVPIPSREPSRVPRRRESFRQGGWMSW